MDYNAKRARLSGVIYIILALMLATIMCVTLFTAIASRRETTPPEDTTPVTDIASDTDAAITPITDNSHVVDAGPDAIVTEPQVTETEPATEDVSATPEPVTLTMPLDGIVSVEFSGDTPVFSITMNDYRVHSGIDIEASDGSAVKSCGSGIVADIYKDDMRGNCISIDHGNGMVSTYCGMSEELAEGIVEGCSVSAGTVLGAVGEDALFENAQPTHLHFELTVDGTAVNPLEYIPYDASAASAYYGE